MMPTFDDVLDASRILREAVMRTPTVPAPRLSALCGIDIVLKLENLQRTGSFKARGALIKMLSLSEEERRRGVIAMSAGNHAQGVAFHARRLSVPATIVMPRGTPFTKVEQTESYGARVLLLGDTLAEAAKAAQDIARTEELAFIHPYDDPAIIAGQGTVALEAIEDGPPLDTLIVPIGGGGLIAGTILAARAKQPSLEVVGVQAALYPSMRQAVAGMPPDAPASAGAGGTTLAEGIAVKSPGRITQRLIAEAGIDILTVGEASLERAVETFVDTGKLVVEGAGAAPLAALFEHAERFRGRSVGLIVSGGNIDGRLLASILMRGMARSGRMARLRIEIPDTPGTLARLSRLIGDADGNIIEIYHQRLFYDVPVKMAEVDAVIETRGSEHIRTIVNRLREAGFPTRALGNTSQEDGT